MDWIRRRDSCLNFLEKYRYGILAVAVGLLLMTLPGGRRDSSPPEETVPAATEAADPAEELEEILGAIDGAGRVRVLLTVKAGAETIFQSDLDCDAGEDRSTNRQDTVIVTDGDRREQGLVRQVNPPVYQGAVVLCQGADAGVLVRLAIVEAVSCATGLGADRISVVKMK